MQNNISKKAINYANAITDLLIPLMQQYEEISYNTNILKKHEEKIKLYLNDLLEVSIENGQLFFSSSDNGEWEEKWSAFKVLSDNLLKGKNILPDNLLLEISIVENNKIEVIKLDNTKENNLAEIYLNEIGQVEKSYFINQNTQKKHPEKVKNLSGYILSEFLMGSMSHSSDMVM